MSAVRTITPPHFTHSTVKLHLAAFPSSDPCSKFRFHSRDCGMSETSFGAVDFMTSRNFAGCRGVDKTSCWGNTSTIYPPPNNGSGRTTTHTIERRLNLVLAFAPVFLSSVVHGAGPVVAGESGRASFSPAVVQGWTSSIGGLFGSQAPDLMALNPIMSSLKGVDLSNPQMREALAPVFAAVQSQVQALQANAAAQATFANPALATKLVAANILGDFQLTETRPRLAEFSRVYHDALPSEEKAKIRAKLLMLHMESMVEALGRTSVDDAPHGIVMMSAGNAAPAQKIPDSWWKLQPAPKKPSNGAVRRSMASRDSKVLKPRKVMQDILSDLGPGYAMSMDEYGFRIRDQNRMSGDSTSGQVIFGGLGLNANMRWFLTIMSPALTPIVKKSLEKHGIAFESNSDSTGFIIPGIVYDDLPRYDFVGKLRFRSGLVRVENGEETFNKNMVYFYHGKQQICRIKLDSAGGVTEVSFGDGLTNGSLAKLAVAVTPNLPFREYLIRYFDIQENDPDLLRYAKAYELEQWRIEEIRKAYDSTPKLPGWETSNPRRHDPSNFRYLVHTWSEMLKSFSGMRTAQQARDGLEPEKQAFDPIAEPERFIARKFISTSLIDQAHYSSWAKAGFILQVPVGNILKAAPEDIGTIASEQRGYGRAHVPPAESILKATRFDAYNEVLIQGTNPKTGNQISILGGVIVLDPITGDREDPKASAQVEHFCKQRGLPVVFINRPI
jgi:hypothetical protein